MKNEDILYQAMLARDHRFDGKFFIGVKTTGIYCRPICPAKPKKENIEFFPNYLLAEKAGYRPCLRCRPESAPDSPVWIGKSAMVQRAIRLIHQHQAIEFNEDEFAEKFGVSARHLRRVFVEEIGKTPKQLASENRLNIARKLIVETSLPITDIAYASGFSSIRRFNDAFKLRFKKSPKEIRQSKSKSSNEGLQVTLSYRPPFDFEGLLKSYRNHQIGKLEEFSPHHMVRIISYEGEVGKVFIRDDKENARLIVEIDFPLTRYIHPILQRVREMFDLNSDPVVVANALEESPALKKLLKKHQGIRLPSGWDPFEIAISTILGQLVSVKRARELTGDLIELLGEETKIEGVKLFPTPEVLAKADLRKLKTTEQRKQTLKTFSKLVSEGKISLEATQPPEDFAHSLKEVKGIGPWTSDYMSLKVIRNTDAFPQTDLIIARALEKYPLSIINQMSPWRGYIATLIWLEYYQTLSLAKGKSK